MERLVFLDQGVEGAFAIHLQLRGRRLALALCSVTLLVSPSACLCSTPFLRLHACKQTLLISVILQASFRGFLFKLVLWPRPAPVSQAKWGAPACAAVALRLCARCAAVCSGRRAGGTARSAPACHRVWAQHAVDGHTDAGPARQGALLAAAALP